MAKLVLILLSWTVAAPAQVWSVRLVNLVPKKGRIDEGTKAKLRINANSLVCDSPKTQLCDIPLRSIRGLSHDVRVRNRAAEYGDSGGIGSCYGYGCAADLFLMAVLAPVHVRWEYVTIQWRDSGLNHTTILRFSKKDFPSFEREMVTQTSLTFEDAARQRDTTRQLIEQRKPEALPIQLDRGTFIRNELVKSGLYQILIVEREPGTGNLFFFRGKEVDWKKLAWVIPVTIIPGSEQVGRPEPEYSPLRYEKRLDAIRMRGRVVRVVP
jgi:hypothetical protein